MKSLGWCEQSKIRCYNLSFVDLTRHDFLMGFLWVQLRCGVVMRPVIPSAAW
jgi:hypothetical protein